MAGLAAALELSRRGLTCLVVERGASLGGQAARFGCKAAPDCQNCGACRLGDLLGALAGRPGVSFLTGAKPISAIAQGSGWRVDLTPSLASRQPGQGNHALTQDQTVQCQAVILAVGHTPFHAGDKTRFGHGRVPGVISGRELEEALAAEGASPLPPGGKAAFIQCVGSRDDSLGRLYCSRVCCGYALRLARQLRHGDPDCSVSFFHMDVQGYGRAWEAELAEMRADMRFVRAMPGEVIAGVSGPELVYSLPGEPPTREEFDLVVLSVGITPPAGAAALAALFGASQDQDGFLGSQGTAGCASGASGVLVAGCAAGPLSIEESMTHAAQAAAAAQAHLAGGRGGGS